MNNPEYIMCSRVRLITSLYYSSSSSANSLGKHPLKLSLSPETSICVTSLAMAPGSSDPEACQLSLAGNALEVFLMILRECSPTIQRFRVTTPCDDKRTGLPCPDQQSPAVSGCRILNISLAVSSGAVHESYQ